MIVGVEGIHEWETGLVLNDRAAMPHYRIEKIGGLRSAPDFSPTADPALGRTGEVPRLADRLGKTITYEGLIVATKLNDLEAANAALVAAFSGTTERKMTAGPHPGYAGPALQTREFYARPLDAGGDESQDATPWRKSRGFERPFTLSLRLSDPRFYNPVADDVTATVVSAVDVSDALGLPFVPGSDLSPPSGDQISLTVHNDGTVDTDPIIRINGPCSNPSVTNRTTGKFLRFRDITVDSGDAIPPRLPRAPGDQGQRRQQHPPQDRPRLYVVGPGRRRHPAGREHDPSAGPDARRRGEPRGHLQGSGLRLMPDANNTLYTGSAPVYAHDLRHVWDDVTEGVVDLAGGDFLVTAGATGLSVDVAAGVAFVTGDDDPDQGNYRNYLPAPVNSSSFAGGGLQAADATKPRIDVIVLHVYDDEYDGSGSEGYELEVLTGTPTTGATLVNRNGAAAVPDTALWLADVLVPATATSITAPNIADKRIAAAGASVVPDALVYKGVIDCSANPNYPAADAGDVYVVSVAGKIGGASGVSVEVGDLLLCKVDGTASGTQAGVGANWDIIQSNLVGAVTGPASATDSDFAQFDGTTGKLIKGRRPLPRYRRHARGEPRTPGLRARRRSRPTSPQTPRCRDAEHSSTTTRTLALAGRR
jgi:hypothetical protein